MSSADLRVAIESDERELGRLTLRFEKRGDTLAAELAARVRARLNQRRVTAEAVRRHGAELNESVGGAR